MFRISMRKSLLTLTAGVAALAIAATATMGGAKPAAADSGPVFKPDLHVTFQSKVVLAGRALYYFQVKNNGIGDAPNVHVARGATESNGVSVWGLSNPQALLGTLKSGESRTVMVFCDPEPGYQCAGAFAYAQTPFELDDSDNYDKVGSV